ncbi:integrator complex subunit 8-like [Ctenocephalides felis]|uniref:integrator complex subunit 8-like n=1 Tax=Ctenocephalides felis TaxID=7515 RepID=UPI000E6E3D4D|nr:integrator complex subunit 8-like [Ctenocephalides felis]
MNIKEYAAATLLALADWDTLASLERQYCSLEIFGAMAHAANDLVKYKASKKLNRDAWDLMLPLFGTVSNKRSNTGNMMHRDSPISANKENLLNFLSRLRDATVFSVVISLLTKLHNLLKDEPNMELNVEYLSLWPGMVSNSNSYNSRTVSETLRSVLNEAVKYYPNNTNWIKLQGDLDFVYGHFESAMRKYIEAIIVGSEYMTLPLNKPLIDDTLIRRMIKTCCSLGCNTQAAVLCQFLEETDYVLAFKSLSEKSTSFDAMDAYYAFIWDPALLEFIVNLHHKRGESKRRQQAISLMGLLELNSNNNEEIQREAAAIRKSQFIKALDSQFRQ